MGIEIEIRTGNAGWSHARPLLDSVWPPATRERLSWGHLAFAHADLRVLVESTEGVACHVGIYWRNATWDGREVRIGGIGGVATRADCRRRGYASVALEAAIQTLRHERATDFAMLFCESHNAAFYQARRWRAFTGDVVAERPNGAVRLDVLKPHVFDLKRAPRDGTIDLCGLPW